MACNATAACYMKCSQDPAIPYATTPKVFFAKLLWLSLFEACIGHSICAFQMLACIFNSLTEYNMSQIDSVDQGGIEIVMKTGVDKNLLK